MQVLPGETAQSQNIPNHAVQTSRRRDHALKVGGVRSKLGPMVFEHNLSKLPDGAQRRPQVVREAKGVGFQFSVAFLELRRAFGDRLFKISCVFLESGPGLFELLFGLLAFGYVMRDRRRAYQFSLGISNW